MDKSEIIKIIESSIEDDIDIDPVLISRYFNIIQKIRISWGYSALTYACLYGNIKVIQTLIKAGLDINELDENEFSPLFIATQKGKTEAVKLLLNFGVNPNQLCTGHKHTALFEALLWDYQHIASLLISYGTDVNIVAMSGLTALHIAAARNLQGITEELLNNNADIGIKDNDEKLPIDYAKEKDHREIIAIFDRFNNAGRNNSQINTDSVDISVTLAKAKVDEIIESVKFAKNNKIDLLLDDLVIQLVHEIQKIVLRGFNYKADATPKEAIELNQMNCQSRINGFSVFLSKIPLSVKAIISPGHVVLVYKLSTGDLLIIDDVIKRVINYKIVSIKDITCGKIIYADIFPIEKWGIIGDVEEILMASIFQMMALKLKRESKYDLSVACFKKAISHFPNYPEFHFGYSVSLKLAGNTEQAIVEKDKAEGLMKLIDNLDQP